MRILRYKSKPDQQPVLAALTDDGKVYDLPAPDLMTLVAQARSEGITPTVWIQKRLNSERLRTDNVAELELAVPVEAPEV